MKTSTLGFLSILLIYSCLLGGCTNPPASTEHKVTLYAIQQNGVWFPAFGLTGNAVPAVSFAPATTTQRPYFEKYYMQEVISLPGHSKPSPAALVLYEIREGRLPYQVIDSEGAAKLGIGQGVKNGN